MSRVPTQQGLEEEGAHVEKRGLQRTLPRSFRAHNHEKAPQRTRVPSFPRGKKAPDTKIKRYKKSRKYVAFRKSAGCLIIMPCGAVNLRLPHVSPTHRLTDAHRRFPRRALGGDSPC